VLKPSEKVSGRTTRNARNAKRNSAGKESAEEKAQDFEELKHITAVSLLALCGISSLFSVVGAKPLNIFFGILGAYCIPLAFLFWKGIVQPKLSLLAPLEFLILAYPIVVAFAPHFHINFNPAVVVTVICAGIPAISMFGQEGFWKHSGDESERSSSELASRLTIFNILWSIFGVALVLRAFLPYEHVFRGGVWRFGSDDPVFHMRLVENALFGDHFPFRIFYDAFTYFPFGSHLHFAPLYDQIMILAPWIVSAGRPTLALTHAIAAYYPAILGACVVFPAYFIGKTIHNRATGLISAALIAIIPGQFLSRSTLGYCDHHVAEVLFSTVAMLFLILAVKHAKEQQSAFFIEPRRDWAVLVFAAGAIIPILALPWAWGLLVSFIFFALVPLFAIFVRDEAKPLFFTLAAGISLGVYLLMWVAGLMFAFIIFIYGIIQYIIDAIRGEDIDYLCKVLAFEFIIPLIMLAPFFNLSTFYNERHIATFALGFIIFSAPLAFKYALRRREERALGAGASEDANKGGKVTGGGGAVVGRTGGFSEKLTPFLPLLTLAFVAVVASVLAPSVVSSVLGAFSALTPRGGALTIAEAHPLFEGGWAWFVAEPITLIISYFALAYLAWMFFERRRPEHLLMLLWSLFILAAVGALIPGMGQNRFAYYLAVNASILTGLFATKTYEIVESGAAAEDAEARRKEQRAARKKKGGVKKKGRVEAEKEAFDLPFIALTTGVFAALFAGIKYVGISALIPWLLLLLLLLFWKQAREKGRKEEKNLRRSLVSLLLITFILFPFPLNALTPSESLGVPAGEPACVHYSLAIASERWHGAPDDWYDALTWMRNNTPDPGVDYYTTYELNETTGRYNYPESAYGVMSWWDYGHIITFIGHRIPNANPFQAGIGGPPVVKYYDANGDGRYTKGEAIVADKDRNGKFTEEDEILFGEFGEVPINAKLRRFSIDEMYYDANDNYKYDKGEAIVADKDGNSRFTDSDEVLMGEAPPNNATLRILAFIPGACEFLLAQNESVANKILDELGSRYVISDFRMIDFTCWVYPVWAGEPTTNYCMQVWTENGTRVVRKPKFWRSMEIRLHLFDGRGFALSENEFVEPLKHYRLVHESPSTVATFGGDELKYVKVFEYVKGARVVGSAPAGSIVEISTNVTTSRGRTFTYAQRMLSNGSFSFVVPYSTECPSPISPAEGGTNYTVCASTYKLRQGHFENNTVVWDVERNVEVPESAVLNGNVVRVNL